jgi:hypothetical protein
MIREAFVTWILTTMIALSPPHREHWEPAAQESYAQADARYRAIAETIVDGVFDPAIEPVFKGPRGRQNTAMFVTIWWNAESGFRRDVDLGIGRARTAKAGWNDYGRSWCMGQINLGRKRRPDPHNKGQWIEDSPLTTPEGWYGRELCQDRNKCLQATLRVMRQSVRSCRKLPWQERMAAYAAGTCTSSAGRAISRQRMSWFYRWYKRGRPPYTDAQLLAELEEGRRLLKKRQDALVSAGTSGSARRSSP